MARPLSLIGPEGEPHEVPVKAVKPGDHVLVRPGDRISVDGDRGGGLARGSMPASSPARRSGEPVAAGSQVYAGTVNVEGALTVRVTAAAAGTLLDEVNRLVETASEARSRYLRLADRAARIYSPIVHVTALATAIGWMLAGAGLHDSIITAIAVLIITCPCALALAVPATQVVAAGALFRAGVLLQSGDAIERIAACDTIVFDKTGTLTMPDPRVVNAADIEPRPPGTRHASRPRQPASAGGRAGARGAGPARRCRRCEETAGQGVPRWWTASRNRGWEAPPSAMHGSRGGRGRWPAIRKRR